MTKIKMILATTLVIGCLAKSVAFGDTAFGLRSSTAEVTRNPLIYAVFGNSQVDLKATSQITVASNSGDIANIASNSNVTINTDVEIWGRIDLGKDESGQPATLVISGSPNIHGGIKQVNRIDPDPLDTDSGPLAEAFATYSTKNDNLTAQPPITDSRIYLANTGDTMTLGAGNYYLESITLNKSCKLILDTTNGPVSIYLTGPLEAKEGSEIDVNGSPADVAIYSNSTDSLVFKNSSSCAGAIYAPKASVQMMNNSNIYGMIWADQVIIANSATFQYEPTTRTRFLKQWFSIRSWKDKP